MPRFTILYDEPQEAEWFRNLDREFQDADEIPITDASRLRTVQKVLSYDRPDIVLLDRGMPILVVEETVEVPSGHNVGQRFARIAASAEAGIPFLYFGPYVAKKHGGITAGPRYMNVRLFLALDAMERITGTAVTTINWPVDAYSEVLRGHAKDADVREYISTLLTIRARSRDMGHLNRSLLSSQIHHRMVEVKGTSGHTRWGPTSSVTVTSTFESSVGNSAADTCTWNVLSDSVETLGGGADRRRRSAVPSRQRGFLCGKAVW